VTGKYFHKLREARVSQRGRDEALAARLWQLSEKIVGNEFSF